MQEGAKDRGHQFLFITKYKQNKINKLNTMVLGALQSLRDKTHFTFFFFFFNPSPNSSHTSYSYVLSSAIHLVTFPGVTLLLGKAKSKPGLGATHLLQQEE